MTRADTYATEKGAAISRIAVESLHDIENEPADSLIADSFPVNESYSST